AMVFFCLAALCLNGCSWPISPPSRLMLQTSAPAGVPPSDKALVLIHRPYLYYGYRLYGTVWDGTRFIADLGNCNSVAYPCEPGQHYFINYSPDRVGVVDAQLLPAQIYDLLLDSEWTWIPGFQLEPIKRVDPQRKDIPSWEKAHRWITRGPAAAKYE